MSCKVYGAQSSELIRRLPVSFVIGELISSMMPNPMA